MYNARMKSNLPTDWHEALRNYTVSPAYTKLLTHVHAEYLDTSKAVYPPQKDLFKAFHETPLSKVKVVILGQDPYHGPGQAHGLSFSVPVGEKVPPSLRNIYKELNTDPGIDFVIPTHGYLQHWADQGVLLLNTTLTVAAGQAGSHQKRGWEAFTDTIIQQLNAHREHLVFMLWGQYARKKSGNIDHTRHCVLQSTHPSPLSAHRGFLGCRHFSQANRWLQAHAQAAIDWQLPALVANTGETQRSFDFSNLMQTDSVGAVHTSPNKGSR